VISLVPRLQNRAPVRQPASFILATASAFASVAVAASAASAAGAPSETPPVGAALFSERCSACHNIGGGVKIGPDLLGVVQRRNKSWFGRFVRGPAAAIDGGDPIAAELYKKFQPVRMPDQPLTDAEVDGVWAYFAACTTKGGCLPIQIGPRWGTDATEQEVALGRDLFSGHHHLRGGGAPCFACHAVRGAGFARAGAPDDGLGLLGGGTLGPNLTFAYARLGEKGMTPLLESMSSPVMHAVYEAAPLEADEQFALKAYLAQLARDGTKPRRERDFFLLGIEGMGIVLGAFTLRARASKTVDKKKDLA
jgi:mono/diheme cytochrome c family protein